MVRTPHDDIQIPIVVRPNRKSSLVDVYVPDMQITIHGQDFVEALAKAVTHASAIYYYTIEHGMDMALTTSYSAAEQMCKAKDDFATFMALLP